MDLYPTLCDLAGIPVPTGLDARSLAPVIEGRQPKVRDCLFTAYRDCQRSIRDDRWKLIRYPLIDKTQLFDLQADPHEMTDLAGKPEFADKIKELTTLLEKTRKEYGDTAPLQVANPKPAEWTPPTKGEKTQEQAESRGRSMKQTLLLTTLLLVPLAGLHATETPASADKPNIVFILADDAGIGDFSCYGCKYGVTPNIDRLAKEGMLFTHAYSGNAVCCPSRCVLMTGLHPGHALFRANDSCRPTAASRDGVFSLPADQMTVARMLHDAGYATGGFGKWGLGNPGTTGAAEKEGFDEFFGYYDQVHAHNYYTDHFVRNGQNVPIRQDGKQTWADYSHTHIANETLKFIEQNKDRPFFCYAAWTPPHGDYVIPSDAPYSKKPWAQVNKNYAAMVSLIDKTSAGWFGSSKNSASRRTPW